MVDEDLELNDGRANDWRDPTRPKRGRLPVGAIAFAVALAACARPVREAGAEEDRAMDRKPPPALGVSDPGPYVLGTEPLQVRVAVQGNGRPLAEAASGGAKILLVIERLELLRPGATYEVYLDPPEGRGPNPEDGSFLGHISLFGKAGEAPPTDRAFDVGARIRARLEGGARLDGLRVLIVPPLDELRPSKDGSPALRFRAISLVRQEPPAAEVPPKG